MAVRTIYECDECGQRVDGLMFPALKRDWENDPHDPVVYLCIECLPVAEPEGER